MDQLIPLLSYVSLHALKSMLLQQIQEMNVEIERKAYFNVSAIDEILPDDLLQHTVSFSGSDNTKGINKKWKQLSHKAETNYLREKYKSINNKELLCENEIKYDNNNNITWIVSKRHKLHPIESKLGYKGPFAEIEDVLNECKDNDRIIVHNGQYQLKHDYEIDKSLQIFGVGYGATIKGTSSLTSSANVYFEDITLELEYAFECTCSVFDANGICVNSGSKLWMKNCNFLRADIAILVEDDADCMVNNCSFLSSKQGVEISANARNVTIMDCMFRGCGIDKYPCIGIHKGFEDDYRVKMNLKCKRNIFKNNEWYPILEYTKGKDNGMKRVLIENKTNNHDFDPNKIYYRYL